MKWNLYFVLKGPGGEAEAPSRSNPIASPNIITLVRELTNSIDLEKFGFGLELVGLRIE